jgi:hypothetical protein
LSISGLDSTKNYFIYVAGNNKDGNKFAAGSTSIPGNSTSTTVIALALQADTYQLGAWVFEGTNPDTMRPALTFWKGNPVDVIIT